MNAQAAAQAAVAHDEKKERADKIDFKMVTFSLGGKEYGIDIMNVKEIARAGRFTYVPNAAPFVRGVYNLRGDIISIIDLRIMFHLPAERKDENALESLLILRVEDHVFGVIVDYIDKVVGVSSAAIQPPHPIFGDINVKYIKGIIENQGKLYIILNVEKLFAPKKEEPRDEPRAAAAAGLRAAPGAPSPRDEARAAAQEAAGIKGDLNAGFVAETLATFKKFSVSTVNDAWFRARYAEWRAKRGVEDVQLHAEADADQFLSPFYSPGTGALWSEDYAAAVAAALPPMPAKSLNVWNPGCGKGYESYSVACILKAAYPEARVKVWANDSDLLSISMAPNMVFDIDDVPERYREFMVKGRNGWSFTQALRDSIFFEFHDVLNANPIPPADFIVCRDTVSFMAPQDQKRVLADFSDKAKEGAALLMGAHETMPLDGWVPIGPAGLSLYAKGSR